MGGHPQHSNQSSGSSLSQAQIDRQIDRYKEDLALPVFMMPPSMHHHGINGMGAMSHLPYDPAAVALNTWTHLS